MENLKKNKKKNINRNKKNKKKYLTSGNHAKQFMVIRGSDAFYAPRTPGYMMPNLIAPPRTTASLKYKSDLLDFSAGATFIVKSFVANGLYDPDPGIFSTSYAGFEWWSVRYSENLVQRSVATWGANNQNTTPVAIAISFSFEQLDTTLTTWAQVRDACENGFTTGTALLGEKGGFRSTVKLTAVQVLQDIVGKRIVYQTSELYSGGSGTNPTVPIFVNFLAYEPTNSVNLSAGILCDITLKAQAEFFGIKQMADVPIIREKPEKTGLIVHYGDYKYRYGHSSLSLEARISDKGVEDLMEEFEERKRNAQRTDGSPLTIPSGEQSSASQMNSKKVVDSEEVKFKEVKRERIPQGDSTKKKL